MAFGRRKVGQMKKGGFLAGILFSAAVGGAAYLAYKLYKKKEEEKVEDEAFDTDIDDICAACDSDDCTGCMAFECDGECEECDEDCYEVLPCDFNCDECKEPCEIITDVEEAAEEIAEAVEEAVEEIQDLAEEKESDKE